MADTTAQHAEAMIAVVGAAPLVPMADTRDGMRRLLADGQNVFGPPNRFEMDHFHSPDPDGPVRPLPELARTGPQSPARTGAAAGAL
ncbi:hypothetical protein AB0B51_32430, partial [Streptomyces griseus]|uniref:hypothetical protein n=1 Tax=Streptomyces griseus TaxID=1911 RepID=UPI0033CDCCA8